MYLEIRTSTTERFWWAVITVLAAALVLLMLRQPASGDDRQPQRPPRLLPAVGAEFTDVVASYRMGDAAIAHYQMEVLTHTHDHLTVDPSIRVWNVLLEHASGKPQAALHGWEETQLPPETEAYRLTAMAVAQMECGDLDAADDLLADAWATEPGNPLVHFYSGWLLLGRSHEMPDYPDAVEPESPWRLANWRPVQVAPNSKAAYRLAAAVQLEAAIEHAPDLFPSMPLIPDDWTAEPELRATIGDLLTALGAAQFETGAHHSLGYLFAERGNAALAEHHLDRAVGQGASVAWTLLDVASQYEGQGRYWDAARVYSKTLMKHPDWADSLQGMVRNLQWAICRD